MSPPEVLSAKTNWMKKELLRNINPFKPEFTSSSPSSNTSCRNSRLVADKDVFQVGDKVKKDSVINKQFHEDYRSKGFRKLSPSEMQNDAIVRVERVISALV